MLPKASMLRHRLLQAVLWLGWSAPLLAIAPVQAADTEWPCIQRKVATLTATQMWDGPQVEGLSGWHGDPEMERLIKVLVSRATPVEKANETLKQWADAQPEAERDEKLKNLFAGVLKTTNDDRSVVMSGIERFQRRQMELSARIQDEGAALGALRAKAATDTAAKAELAAAEERYRWDARFFAERQESLPFACEIPVEIEQRAFDLAREIRALMKE